MEIINTIRDKVIEHLTAIVIGLVSLPTLILYWAELVSFLKRTLFQSHPQLTVGLLILLFVLTIVELAYIIYLRKRLVNSTTKKFGVHWDHQLNPLCPDCDKLLQHPKTTGIKLNLSPEAANLLFNKPSLSCSGCNKVHMLVNDSGVQLSLTEAKKLLK